MFGPASVDINRTLETVCRSDVDSTLPNVVDAIDAVLTLGATPRGVLSKDDVVSVRRPLRGVLRIRTLKHPVRTVVHPRGGAGAESANADQEPRTYSESEREEPARLPIDKQTYPPVAFRPDTSGPHFDDMRAPGHLAVDICHCCKAQATKCASQHVITRQPTAGYGGRFRVWRTRTCSYVFVQSVA